MRATMMAGLTRGWLNADAPLNMPCMEGTLEVSTLSGWLNGGEAGRDAGRTGLDAGRTGLAAET